MNVVLMMLETTLTLRKRGLCLRDWGQPGQNEQALAEWAPQLWEADTQKLARLVRNYGIETVNAATMARGVHRAILAVLRAPAQLADVVVPMLRGA